MKSYEELTPDCRQQVDAFLDNARHNILYTLEDFQRDFLKEDVSNLVLSCLYIEQYKKQRSSGPLSVIQEQTDMVRFNLDVYLNTFIRCHPDLLEGDDFRNFLLDVRDLLENVAERVGPMQNTALSMTVKDLQELLREEREKLA